MTTPPDAPVPPEPPEDDDDHRGAASPPPAEEGGGALAKLLGVGVAAAGLPLLGIITIPLIIVLIAVVVITAVIGGGGGRSNDCIIGAPNNNIDANMPIGEIQRETAKQYIAVAKALNVPIEGQIIITMAGMQESGLKVLSNTTVPNSDAIPHHGTGSNGKSVGSLQQQAGMGYSPYEDKDPEDPENLKWLMDNEYAAAAFFGGPESPSKKKGLLDIDGWQSMAPGEAAQAVQASGVPDGYNKWEGSAKALVNSLQDTPKADLSRWKNRAGQPAGGGKSGSSGATTQRAAGQPSPAASPSSPNAPPADSASPADEPTDGNGKAEPVPDVPGDANNGGSNATPASDNTLTGRSASTDPSTLPPGPNEDSGLQPNAINVGRAVAASFPTVKDILGSRPGDPQDHGKGLARDIMIPAYNTPAGKKLGDSVVRYVQLNADALGVEYVMWRHHIWMPGQGWKWVEERGNDNENHMNHVHVSVKAGKAEGKVTGSGNSDAPDTAAEGNGSCNGDGGNANVGNAKGVVAAALKWVGTDYAWGGGDKTGPTKGIRDGGVADSFGDYNKIGFDCSGLMEFAYWAGAQMSIGGTTYEQYPSTQKNSVGGAETTPAQMKPGDLIFYGGPGGANHHVSMYIGDGKIVEAPQSGSKVQVVPWQPRDQFAVTRPLGDKADENTGGDSDGTPKVDKVALAPQDGDPSMAQWDALAECESKGDWAIDSGNGFYGGIQFDKQTWTGNGGDKYGPTANKASKEEQIEIATKVFRERGWSPWPTCGANAKAAA